MNLEERVQRLENFMGDMDRISTIYASTLQEICDKYFSLLYIEKPSSETNKLMVDGWLGDIDINKLPKNTIINIRASHQFKLPEGETKGYIVFKRDNQSVELPLMKYDPLHPGNLIELKDADFIFGVVYDIYINSQNIAIMSTSDAGNMALQLCATLEEAINKINDSLNASKTSITTEELGAIRGSFNTLTTDTLTISKPISLPTKSIASTPTENNHVANKKYVDDAITKAINKHYSEYTLFGTEEPSAKLKDAPEKAIYYRYK